MFLKKPKLTKKIITILSEAFKSIPAGNYLVKQDSKKNIRYKKLAKFVYTNALKKKGVYLSSNKEGVAIAYIIDPNNNKKTIHDFIESLKFVVSISGIRNAIGILKRQKYIRKQRPKNEKYIYWEVTGINLTYRGHASSGFSMGELRDQIYEKAHKEQLSIYTETSIRRNMIVYRRYGFDVCHEWIMPDKSTLWFMHYDTKKKPLFKSTK